MFIGDVIKAIRKSKKMSLTELSSLSGVQLATLSRIEHKKMVGTLESHMQIAKALSIDVTDLYKEAEKGISITDTSSPEEQTDIFTHSEKSSYEILTKNVLQKKMMPTLIHIEPNGKTNVEQNAKGSEKFIYALDGNVSVHVGENNYPLSRNHTIYFDSSQKHYFSNKGKTKAKLLSITTPVSL